jgi:hypothetical protein
MLIPTPMSDALNAFEARMKRRLDHPAFSKFGKVTVTRSDVKKWSDDWSLDEVTEAEKRVMAEMLLGSAAPVTRRDGPDCCSLDAEPSISIARLMLLV